MASQNESNSEAMNRNHKQGVTHDEQAPGGGPRPLVAHDRREAIVVFIKTLQGLYEKDFGDFKRKVSLYLDQLAGDLRDAPIEAKRLLVRMKDYVVYDADLKIESTRARLIRDAQEILSMLR
jgi:hypothetical protein